MAAVDVQGDVIQPPALRGWFAVMHRRTETDPWQIDAVFESGYLADRWATVIMGDGMLVRCVALLNERRTGTPPLFSFDEPVTMILEGGEPVPAIVRVVGPDWITLEPQNMDPRNLTRTGDHWQTDTGLPVQIERLPHAKAEPRNDPPNL